MGDGKLFTHEQIQQIIDAAQARPVIVPPVEHPHPCRFDNREAKLYHGLADTLENGGLDNFRMLLELGATLRQIRKWGTAALVTTIIIAAIGAFWVGVKASITKGG